MKNNLLPIANEGWIYIAYTFGAFVIFSILDFNVLQLFTAILFLFFLFLFRNPERELPRFEENSVLCPVDGEVVSIEELEDPEYAYKIMLNTRYKDVGILRSPMNSSVHFIKKTHGTRLSFENKQAKKMNENTSIVFEDIHGNKLKVSHTLKQSLCGVHVDLEKNNTIAQSARYGIMVNGLTEIYLPQNFRFSLSVGEETKASESLVGYFS